MECNNHVHSDGETWNHYLTGETVLDIAIGPDGSIWYTTEGDDKLRQIR